MARIKRDRRQCVGRGGMAVDEITQTAIATVPLVEKLVRLLAPWFKPNPSQKPLGYLAYGRELPAAPPIHRDSVRLSLPPEYFSTFLGHIDRIEELSRMARPKLIAIAEVGLFSQTGQYMYGQCSRCHRSQSPSSPLFSIQAGEVCMMCLVELRAYGRHGPISACFYRTGRQAPKREDQIYEPSFSSISEGLRQLYFPCVENPDGEQHALLIRGRKP